jgi:hypothetical protein
MIAVLIYGSFSKATFERKPMRKFVLVVLLAVTCGAVSMLAAPIPAVTFSNLTGESLANGPFTLGWQFTVNQNITVTALGAFDDSQNGLAESHDVGIWDSLGNLVGSTTVAAGTVDPLVNQFRYSSVSFTLAPGTYDIGALWLDGADNNTFPGDISTLVSAPAITFVQNSYIGGGTLADPTNGGGSVAAYFGPNFLYTATPEPGTLVLLGSGLLGAVGVIRRKLNV